MTSRMLRWRGQPATDSQRISWTIQQAALPLFFANATTAVSLYVNCLSNIASIFQFGLCGGTLIFVNFAIALCATPAVLLLQDDKQELGTTTRGTPRRHQRAERLAMLHQMLWDHRVPITTAFSFVVVLLTPFALSLRPGADATFTFAPDPEMMRVVSRARLGPDSAGHIFKAAEGYSMPLPALEATYPRSPRSPVLNASSGSSEGAVLPARYEALLMGTFEKPEPHNVLQGCAFAALFVMLQSGDAALLMALGIALRSETSVLFFQAPPTGRTPLIVLALIFSFAGLSSATAHLDTIFSLSVCDFTQEMRIFHGQYVGIAYLLHSALFAHVSLVTRRGVSHGMIHVMDWMSRYRTLATNVFASVSVGFGAVGLVVLILVNGEIEWPAITFGWAWRGPAGAALLTSLVWLYNGAVLSIGAAAASCGEAVSHFRSRPDWLTRLQVLSNLHSFAGWTLLIVAGLPIARDLPNSLTFDVLALWLLFNALAHASLLRVIQRDQPSSLLTPTAWSSHYQGSALLIQGLLVAVFGVGAMLAFANAENPTVCDSDHNHHLSLREIQQCLDAVLGNILSIDLPDTLLGTCLAGLWILDAFVLAVAATAVRTRTHYGCLGPLGETSTTQRPAQRAVKFTRRLLAASAAFGLSGLTVLLLSFSPQAFGAAFGPKAIVASNLLGFNLLLLHTPPLIVLASVFRRGAPILILHPTALSRRSPVPAILALAGAALCFIVGIAIVVTQNSLPNLEWPEGRVDAYGITLSVLLLCDAATLLSLSSVQSAGEPAFMMRPLPHASDVELRQLADALAVGGGGTSFAAAFASFVACNTALSTALFGNTRALAIMLELTLAIHSLGMLAVGYLCRRRLSFGMLEPPSPHEAGLASLVQRRPGTLHVLATVFASHALMLPLLDGWHWWESLGVGSFALLVLGTVVTHGMYAGNVLIQVADRDRSSLRRFALGLTTLFAMACGSCFANAVAGHRLRMPYYAFVPLEYILVVAMAVFALINFVPIVAAMEVRYTGLSLCGFSADDVPHGRSRLPWAFAMLCAAMVCASVGGAAWTAAQAIVTLDKDAWRTEPPRVQVSLPAAERCNLYFGVDFPGMARSRRPSMQSGVDMADPSAQLDLLAVCTLLRRDDSPLHPEGRQSASWGCFMEEFRAWLVAKGRSFPVLPPSEFDRSVLEFVEQSSSWLGSEIGLWSSGGTDDPSGSEASLPPPPPHRVAWMRVGAVPTKFAGGGGEEAMALLADPVLLLRHKAEWSLWLQALPQRARAAAPNSTMDESGASNGHHEWTVPASTAGSVLGTAKLTCAKWSLLATLLAFYRSASTALSLTPLVSMAAIALFTRSLIISYCALYTLAGMVLTLLGLMKLCGLSFGAVSALALALVLGMSVDYIIHIAHAFKNTLLPERFQKSRATVLARATSIGSAAATTLAAVSPLLFAQLLPLREFGQIFVLVTLVSLCFSVAFLLLLMIGGPKDTRRRAALDAEEAESLRRHEAAQPTLTEPHSAGDGWAVQLVDVVEASGPREGRGVELEGMPPLELRRTHGRQKASSACDGDDVDDML